MSPTGKNYLNRIADIRRHNGNAGQLDWPLSRLDFDGCQAMIDVWRSRPMKKDGTCPIASKQCREVIKRLTIRNGFFRWLHRTSEFDWRKPSDFDELDVSVKETAAEISAKASPMQVVSYTLDELAVLNEYATPHERLFLLCGLNCGFKRMEISTLRVCEIFIQQAHPYADTLDFKSNESDSFIKRLRKKSTVYGEWLLWPLTVKAMMWALNRRRQMTHILGGDGKGRAIPFRAESIVLLNDHGHPFTKTTKKGNSNNQITNTWNRLLDRIQKDHEEFRRLPHENLRDTSANLIRRNRDFGSEIAKVFISHGNPFKSDDLLELYSNKPFGRVFEACRWLEEVFGPVFEVTPDNPFPAERKLGGGGLTLKQRKSIQRLEQQGLSAKEIAKKVGCTAATVYRNWGRNGNDAMPPNEREEGQSEPDQTNPQPAKAGVQDQKNCRVGRNHDLHRQSVLEEEMSHVRTTRRPAGRVYGTLWDALWDKKPFDYGTFCVCCPIEAGHVRILDRRNVNRKSHLRLSS